MWARLALLTILLFAGGCSTRPDCSAEVSPISSLKCASASGDKRALLELGKRYEAGDGIPKNEAQAARLYRSAAQPTPDVLYVYSPPVGRESAGRVIPVTTGRGAPGLPEAQYRLALLYQQGRGVKADARRATQLLQAAAKSGYPPALEALQQAGSR